MSSGRAKRDKRYLRRAMRQEAGNIVRTGVEKTMREPFLTRLRVALRFLRGAPRVVPGSVVEEGRRRMGIGQNGAFARENTTTPQSPDFTAP